MEHFDGRDLGTVAREDGPMPVERALSIMEQVLDGLEVAHGMGIIHRDIKPANILLDAQDQVKIVDFGLALVAQSTRSRLTQSGILVGTPEYISPEQITGQEVDGRTDLYSLGIVMYEMMSGRLPFSGSNAVNVLFQHLESEVPPLAEVAPHVPAWVSELMQRCMSRMAADRPSGAAEALALLRRAAA
jgi:serine/threonine-protein kinase